MRPYAVNRTQGSQSEAPNYHRTATNNRHGGILTDDNDALAGELCSKVNTLRELTLNLGEEVQEQNAFLDGSMSEIFSRSEGSLRFAMRRVGLIGRNEGLGSVCGFYCQLLSFAFFFFFLCWILMKFS